MPQATGGDTRAAGLDPDVGSEYVASWRTLYRAAAAAAGVTAALIPIQIAVFIVYPYPNSVAGWYMLLQDKPLAGLIDLDLMLVVDNVLLVVIALAIFYTLKNINPSVVAAATGLWLLAIGMFIASNSAVQMLELSNQFAVAVTDEQRSQTLAGGQAMLANWEGSAFQVSYVVGQLAGILIGIVMLRSSAFGRLVPYALIIGNVVGFGYYLPKVGLSVSAFSGVLLWVWYIAIIRSFLKLGRSAGQGPGRDQ